MTGLGWSLVTILAWGTWLAPLQLAGAVDERVKTLWITLGNLAAAVTVAAAWGFAGLTWEVFWPSLLGGVMWSASGIAAVAAVQRLGMARAMGVWAPLNILVSIAWGVAVFGEMLDLTAGAAAGVAVSVAGMVAGIVLIVSAGDRHAANAGVGGRRATAVGLAAAAAAGLGWGSYFMPIRVAEASAWVAALPMAIGMVVGAGLPALWRRRGRAGPGGGRGVGLAAAAGLLWAVGNYGSLQLMAALGTGRGFAIAQACVVVNAAVGIVVFRRPPPGSRAARRTLLGVLLASAAAAGLGLFS